MHKKSKQTLIMREHRYYKKDLAIVRNAYFKKCLHRSFSHFSEWQCGFCVSLQILTNTCTL